MRDSSFLIQGCVSLEIISVFDPSDTESNSEPLRSSFCRFTGFPSLVDTFFLRRRVKASSIRILRSQLRKAPSYANFGGLREARRQQPFTASSAPSLLPSTRHAMKWSSPRQRENRASNTFMCSCSRFDIAMSSHMGNLSIEFNVLHALFSRANTVRAAR